MHQSRVISVLSYYLTSLVNLSFCRLRSQLLFLDTSGKIIFSQSRSTDCFRYLPIFLAIPSAHLAFAVAFGFSVCSRFSIRFRITLPFAFGIYLLLLITQPIASVFLSAQFIWTEDFFAAGRCFSWGSSHTDHPRDLGFRIYFFS